MPPLQSLSVCRNLMVLVFPTAIGCDRYNPCQQRCVEDDSGVSCACNQGYTLLADGINCQGQHSDKVVWGFSQFMKSILSREHVFLCDYSDIDECALGSAICPDGQGCYNQEGSYRCRTCPPGSEVDPVTKVCRTLPQCTTGFAYNSATGSCQGNAAMKNECKTCM